MTRGVADRCRTELGQRHGLSMLEVGEAVVESPASLVFDGAENRVNTIEAVLVATLRE